MFIHVSIFLLDVLDWNSIFFPHVWVEVRVVEFFPGKGAIAKLRRALSTKPLGHPKMGESDFLMALPTKLSIFWRSGGHISACIAVQILQDDYLHLGFRGLDSSDQKAREAAASHASQSHFCMMFPAHGSQSHPGSRKWHHRSAPWGFQMSWAHLLERPTNQSNLWTILETVAGMLRSVSPSVTSFKSS